MKRSWLAFLIPGALLFTALAFSPVLHAGFLNWDDPLYVLNNPLIRRLSLENITEMFSGFYAGNYHPLTLLSYAADYALFQFRPAGYHAVNLLLHLLNALLVFVWMKAMTGKLQRSFFVFICFCLHPVHVESVAWISQRKDLLCSFFFLSASLAYIRFLGGRQSKRFLLAALGLFIGACLSKPMAVSFPFVLFLYDYFCGRKWTGKMVYEKVPFLILAVLFSVLTVHAQSSAGMIKTGHEIPSAGQIILAAAALTLYLYKLIVPFHLCGLYPYSNLFSPSALSFYGIPALISLSLAGLLFFFFRGNRKVMFAASFFLVTLLPVLQLIPIGNTLIADRYLYLPAIAFFYLLGELAAYAYHRWSRSPAAFFLFVALFPLLFSGWGYLTWRRIPAWKNSFSFYEDILKQYPDSFVARNNLAVAYIEAENYKEAEAQLELAEKILPEDARLFINRTDLYNHTGDTEKALRWGAKAVEQSPGDSLAHYNFANAKANAGDFQGAEKEFQKAIALTPGRAEFYHDLASVQLNLGQTLEAMTSLRSAIKANPYFASSYEAILSLYLESGKIDSALKYYAAAQDRGIELSAELSGRLQSYQNAAQSYQGLVAKQAASILKRHPRRFSRHSGMPSGGI